MIFAWPCIEKKPSQFEQRNTQEIEIKRERERERDREREREREGERERGRESEGVTNFGCLV